MSRIKDIEQGIKDLVAEADWIYMAEVMRKKPNALSVKEKKVEEKIKNDYPLKTSYQRWYSKCLPVIKQVAPDRYSEFVELYKVEKRRELNVTTYGISDYLLGVSTTKYGETQDYTDTFISKILLQRAIINSLRDRIDSVLSDIEGVLQADLFDNELAAAEELLKQKYVRPAGVLAGVVLESHLRKVCEHHDVSLGRRKSTIGNLIAALKDAGHVDTPSWRNLEYLNDLRILCAHKKDREPEKKDVQKLIEGVREVTMTLF